MRLRFPMNLQKPQLSIFVAPLRSCRWTSLVYIAACWCQFRKSQRKSKRPTEAMSNAHYPLGRRTINT